MATSWARPAPDMHEIRPNLWLGSQRGARDEQALVQRGVTHVLSVGDYNLGARQRMRVPASEEDPLERLILTLPDDSSSRLDRHFSVCSSFISEGLKQGGVVLVHCYAGQSRSPTLVAAHLMHELGCTATRAVEMVQQRRPAARPNAGFLSQLVSLEGRLRIEGRLQPEAANTMEDGKPRKVLPTACIEEKPENQESNEKKQAWPWPAEEKDEEKDSESEDSDTDQHESGDEPELESAPISAPKAVSAREEDPFGAHESRVRCERLFARTQRLHTPPGIMGLAAPLRRRRLA
mmetsp:Transcript_48819/g.87915  ORF Transcript_48819/g.87915 Transcript_48819/m.87915 type:complete len:292 (+) Transcript_48819:63-938(+)